MLFSINWVRASCIWGLSLNPQSITAETPFGKLGLLYCCMRPSYSLTTRSDRMAPKRRAAADGVAGGEDGATASQAGSAGFEPSRVVTTTPARARRSPIAQRAHHEHAQQQQQAAGAPAAAAAAAAELAGTAAAPLTVQPRPARRRQPPLRQQPLEQPAAPQDEQGPAASSPPAKRRAPVAASPVGDEGLDAEAAGAGGGKRAPRVSARVGRRGRGGESAEAQGLSAAQGDDELEQDAPMRDQEAAASAELPGQRPASEGYSDETAADAPPLQQAPGRQQHRQQLRPAQPAQQVPALPALLGPHAALLSPLLVQGGSYSAFTVSADRAVLMVAMADALGVSGGAAQAGGGKR